MEQRQLDALRRAISCAGSSSQLARECGLALNAPAMWIARGRVPADHCPDIERATGVRCEELRPDVSWYVLRGTPARKPARMKAKA